jgi:hypothetical protein
VVGPKQKQKNNNVENSLSTTETCNETTQIPGPILNWTGFILRNTHAEINNLCYEDGPEWIAEMWSLWLKNSDYGNNINRTWEIKVVPTPTSSK